MGFPTSLVGRHQYLNALSGLGIVLEKPNFPVTTACPICKENTLYVLDDVITNGVWLFCTACKTHGDIITFGSQIWNTSLPDTLEKFSDLNVISEQEKQRVTPEYSRFVAKYQAVESFWQTAEEQVWNHGDDIISCRLRELGLRYETTECYGLVGVAHYDQIARLCRELGHAKPVKSREYGAAIVYPFYDLPDRITGFLIAQYNDAYEMRQNFIPTHSYKLKRVEAGYFLLNKLLLPHDEQYRGNQFISEDIHWVLRAQTKSINRGGKFLPLIGSYSGREAESYGTSWGSFHHAPRIFHANAISPALISRACNAKGYVSVTATPQTNDTANLITVRTKTKTWQESLKETLPALDEINALSFSCRLSVPPDKLGPVLYSVKHPFSAGFVDRVLAEIATTPPSPQKKWRITERDNSWWSCFGRQICNVCPQIKKIIHTDHGQKIYVGTVTTQDGEVYSFTDAENSIERLGLLAYSYAILTPHKKLVVYDKAWNKKSLSYALQMHTPEIEYVQTSYGWDERNQVFRFDSYEITGTGDVRQIPAWPRRSAKIAFDTPMPVAPLPIRDFITLEHENSYAWHIVAAVAGSLIAPIMNRDPAATAITKEGFKTASAITAALCCPIVRATAGCKRSAHNFMCRALAEFEWPTLVYNTFNDENISNIVARNFNNPIIARLSRPSAVVAPGYGWQTILSTPTKNDADFSVLRHILPAYIQYVLKNRLHMFKQQNELHGQVLRTLHAWLLETYNTAFNLTHAEATFFSPESAHIALFKELSYAFSAGKIAVLPRPRNYHQASNYVVRDKEHWWINQLAVNRYFSLNKSIAPNWSVIVDLLQQSAVYINEQTVHNMNGILLKQDWCDQFWSAGENINTETG